MSQLWTCPHGHQWQDETEATVLAGSPGVVCPICGALAMPSKPSIDAVTFVLSSPVAPATVSVEEAKRTPSESASEKVDITAQTLVASMTMPGSQLDPTERLAPGGSVSAARVDVMAQTLAPSAPPRLDDPERPALRAALPAPTTAVVNITAQTLAPSMPVPLASVADLAVTPASSQRPPTVAIASTAHTFVANVAPSASDFDRTDPLASAGTSRKATVEITAQTFAGSGLLSGPSTAEFTAETHSPTGPKPAPTPAERKALAGYEILGVLGRGGMGVVYKARQQALNRIVALKTLLSGTHGGDEELIRFRIEAEAVARMQHPNIVQVYEVSEREGQPFLAMEFVSGGALDKKLNGNPQAARHAAELMETLARAMHYAHERGIIHRDLKPANVLLTPDGTPKITDFGLAKRLEEDTGQTRDGAIMGTPSYMAPEQAEGKTKELGPPADIYSLGAILYDLLTGRPPFRGETVLDTLEQVRSQEPLRPSRLQPKMPPDLETICLKCLVKDPVKRYPSAGALADDLARFLNNEPIRARPTPTWERAWKWARRRPAAAALIVVSVAAVLSLSVGGFVWAQHERRLHAIAEANKEEALDQKALAEHNKEIAEQNFVRAEKRFQDARDAVDLMLTRVGQERLANEPRMEKVRRDLLENALQFYQRFLDEKSRDPGVRFETVRAFQRVGDIQEMLGDHAKAEKAYRSAVAFLEELITEQPRDPKYRKALALNQNELAVVLHAANRRDDAEKAYQDALASQTKLVEDFPQEPDYRRDLGMSYNNRGIFLQTNQQLPQAEQAYQQAVDLLQKLTAEFADRPDFQMELARTYTNLGGLRVVQRRHPEAKDAYQRALHLQQQLASKYEEVANYRKELARTDLNLGWLLRLEDRREEAEKSYRKAVDVFTDLAAKFANVPDYRQLLAMSYDNLGSLLANDPRKAEPAWRQAATLYGRLAEEFRHEAIYRHKQAISLNELGVALATSGRLADAEPLWLRARDLQEQLIAQYPDATDYWQKLINTFFNLTELYLSLDRSREVEANYHRFVKMLERRVDSFPKMPEHKHELGVVLNNFATFLLRRDKLTEAGRQLREAIHYQQAALKDNPKQAGFRLALCGHYLSLADTLVQLEDHGEVTRVMTELIDVAAASWQDYPRAASLQARCIRLAEQDKRLAAAKRTELVQRYGDQAMNLLRRALAQGYKDVNSLKKAAEFEPLRTREDFRKLLADLETKSQTSSR